MIPVVDNSLFDELSVATEEKTQVLSKGFIMDDDDTFTSSAAQIQAAPVNPIPEQVIEHENPIDFSAEAEMYIEMLDSLLLLGNMYYDKKLTKKYFANTQEKYDYESLYRTPKTSLDPENRAKSDTYGEFRNHLNSLCEKLPLTENERNKLKKPLEKILAANNKELPPGWALAISVGSIIFSRMFV